MKTLSEICDARGDLWVHEKCATWTAATAYNEEKLSATNLVGKAIATVTIEIIYTDYQPRPRPQAQMPYVRG